MTLQQHYNNCKNRNFYIQCSIIFRCMLFSVKLKKDERLNKSSQYNLYGFEGPERTRNTQKQFLTYFDCLQIIPFLAEIFL